MSLFFAELRKVWGSRVFPAVLAILAAANLLLLWMGTRPTAKQPPASAYRAVGAELSDKTMEEKGAYLQQSNNHGNLKCSPKEIFLINITQSKETFVNTVHCQSTDENHSFSLL